MTEKERSITQVNEFRNQIHSIKYSPWTSDLVKPSGKLRFMTAYRFFRKERVPLVKQICEGTEMDGKARQEVIRAMWKRLGDKEKYPYVLMSRADREKAIFASKLSKIKENLIRKYPEVYIEEESKESLKGEGCLKGHSLFKSQIEKDINLFTGNQIFNETAQPTDPWQIKEDPEEDEGDDDEEEEGTEEVLDEDESERGWVAKKIQKNEDEKSEEYVKKSEWKFNGKRY